MSNFSFLQYSVCACFGLSSQVRVAFMKDAYSRAELKDLLNAETLSHRAVFVEEFDWLTADVKREGCVWCKYLELDTSDAAASVLVVRSPTTRVFKAVKRNEAAVAARTAFWAELECDPMEEDSERETDSDDDPSAVLSPSPMELARRARLQQLADRIGAGGAAAPAVGAPPVEQDDNAHTSHGVAYDPEGAHGGGGDGGGE